MAAAGPAATGGGRASRTAYCDAISAAFDLAEQYNAGNAPPDLPDQFAEQLAKAASVAPNEVIVDYMQALRGDVYAQEDFDQYNETTCGVDTGSLRERPASTTAG